MGAVDLQEKDGAVTLRVRVQPRASRDEAAGELGGAIKLRITAPPVDGKANEAIRRLIARMVGVSQSEVEIVSGQSSRDKLIRIHNVTAEQVRARLLG
jgi:uncharacterized protein (TIGR00251 family)